MPCVLFQEFTEIIFIFSTDLGARNESTVKSGIFLRRRFETHFLYLAEYSVKNFITTRQYFVNLTCNFWFRMRTQFHQKLVSYKCMLFVHCLVVLREYFVNWTRVMKLQCVFSGSNFCPESYVRCHVCHTAVVVMWRKKHTPEPSGTVRRKTSNTDSCRQYRQWLATENPHVEELQGGCVCGGGEGGVWT